MSSPLKPELFSNLSELSSNNQPAKNSLFEEFCHSAAYAGVQQPITGISQIVDKVTGTRLEQSTAFMSAPQAAEFGTAKWHAQTLGGAAGGLVPLLISARMAKGALGSAETGFLSRRAAIGLTLKESAATGFISDGLFRPSENKDNFLKERLIAGAGGSLTFSSMTAASLGLGSLSHTAMANSLRIGSTLRNPIVSGILSGVPGGTVSTNYESLVHKNRLSTGTELAQSVYSMSLIGGAFGLKHQIEGPKPVVETTQQVVQRAVTPALELTMNAGGAGSKSKTGEDTARTSDVSKDEVELTPQIEDLLKGLAKRFQERGSKEDLGYTQPLMMLDHGPALRKMHLMELDFGDRYGSYERFGSYDRLGGMMFEREHYRWESDTQKAANDANYAVGKSVLEKLQESGGQPTEPIVPLQERFTVDELRTSRYIAIEGEVANLARPLPNYQISFEEAKALYALEVRNPKEANTMATLLSARGPEVEFIAKEIRKARPMHQFEPSDLHSVFTRANDFFEAKAVLDDVTTKAANKEKGTETESKASTSSETVATPRTVQDITLSEAKALLVLKSMQAFNERHALEQLLEQRGPLAKFVCEKVMLDYDQSIRYMGSQATDLVTPKSITQEYLNNLFDRAQRQQDAEAKWKAMSETPAKDRPKHEGAYPMTLEEANTLASLGMDYSINSMYMVSAMKSRSPEAGWVAEHIEEISKSNRKPSLNKGPIEITETQLAELSKRAGPTLEAMGIAQRVAIEKFAGNPVESPVSIDEANAIRLLRAESYQRSEDLTNSLSKLGAASEYIARTIFGQHNGPEITEARLKTLVEESSAFVDAMGLLERTRQQNEQKAEQVGITGGTTAQPRHVTLEEANALLILCNSPGRHSEDMIAALKMQGEGAEWVATKIAQNRYEHKNSPITKEKLAELNALGDKVHNARVLKADLERQEKEASTTEATATEPTTSTAAASAQGATEGEQVSPTRKRYSEKPVSVEEASAIETLQSLDSETTSKQLAVVIGERGDRQRWMAQWILNNASRETQKREYNLPTLEVAYDLNDAITKSEAPVVIKNKLNPYELASEYKLTSKEQVTNLIEVLQKYAIKNGIHYNDQASMPALIEISNWSARPGLTDTAVGAIHDHVRLTDKSYASETPEKLNQAALGWQMAPTLPLSLAADVGTMPPPKRVAAAVAWNKLLAERSITDVKQFASEIESNDFSQAFYAKILEISTEGRAALVKQMPANNWRAIPIAIDAIYGESLSPETKTGLWRAVRESENPYPMLLGVKGTNFTEALAHLNDPNNKYKARTGDETWSAKTAYQLTNVFKGGWKDWLTSQQNIGRNAHDATYFLPYAPAEEVKGLGIFLQSNSNRTINDLEMVSKRWSDVPAELRQQPLQEIKEHLLANKFSNVVDKPFATEAGQWGMSPTTYKDRETRYRASLAVPVPFDLEARWTVGNLTGRFLPRNDTRGLFVGNHTNCCQHPDGAAAASAWYSQESPRSGVFVVENKAGEIIAESWAWISDNRGLAFDNVEAKGIGKRSDDVKALYEKAAKDLSKEFYRVTLGTGHSDLDTAGWTAAGDKSLKLPSDYSGYTDATNQVILAENPNLKPADITKKSTIRGALLTDIEALEKISRARYPEGWQSVPLDGSTRGLVLEEPGKGIVGYALIEPENRYISDVAVSPDASPQKAVALLKALTQLVKQHGGEWKTDARDSTSYKMLKNMARSGRIEIISDRVTNKMGNEDMHEVIFRAASKSKASEVVEEATQANN